MADRRKSRKKQEPGIAEVEVKKAGYIIGKQKIPNRAWKKQHGSFAAHADGRTVREEQKNHQKTLMIKARRVISKIQRESRRLLRIQKSA